MPELLLAPPQVPGGGVPQSVEHCPKAQTPVHIGKQLPGLLQAQDPPPPTPPSAGPPPGVHTPPTQFMPTGQPPGHRRICAFHCCPSPRRAKNMSAKTAIIPPSPLLCLRKNFFTMKGNIAAYCSTVVMEIDTGVPGYAGDGYPITVRAPSTSPRFSGAFPYGSAISHVQQQSRSPERVR